ncbi:uncharacterized protein EI90DRAFT_2188853 [Cantharellus anzutake]|uniref:uncharacterized protein n=1 Tax=Cantharellus anzutake TaxID=1750568 RepID=UPI00190726E4|nr:uncharacterized protein EI90DRAFT_2188853 [Cantharellus anzutake]KAF8325272.1 hypothetical protein EI90DRAFT_2188853 [Cantharellus anzutake]
MFDSPKPLLFFGLTDLVLMVRWWVTTYNIWLMSDNPQATHTARRASGAGTLRIRYRSIGLKNNTLCGSSAIWGRYYNTYSPGLHGWPAAITAMGIDLGGQVPQSCTQLSASGRACAVALLVKTPKDPLLNIKPSKQRVNKPYRCAVCMKAANTACD